MPNYRPIALIYDACSNKTQTEYFSFTVDVVFKRLAYTLTAYCYGSKSVTQTDASSKRYLWDKISCQTNRTKNNWDRYQIQNIASGSNCLTRFLQFKERKTMFLKYKISNCLDHTYMYIVLRGPYTCIFIAIDNLLCTVSIVEAIKYQNKDANSFAVLTVL